jgi:hypothetical protein
MGHWALTSFRAKVVKRRAESVTHARCVIFRMVKVAVVREFFPETIRWGADGNGQSDVERCTPSACRDNAVRSLD